jgi:hypothetical protein
MAYQFYFSLALLIFGTMLSCQESSTPQEQEATPDPNQLLLDKGQEITAATFTALGGQLQKALKEGGVQHAIDYCNVKALPITDSLSRLHDALIRRVSFKARNPVNLPSTREIEVMQTYQQAIQAGETPVPMLQELGSNRVAYYAPIIVQDLCLKCHGEVGTDIAEADYSVIKDFYPKDKAVGFHAGDLRGIWSIQLKKDTPTPPAQNEQ